MTHLSQPSHRIYKSMLLWSALLVLPVGSSLAGTDLLGQVVILGERDSDTPRPVSETAVAIQGAGETRTNQQGRFRLVLPFAPGVAVTAQVHHPGRVIYHPYRGEFRRQATTAGQPAEPVGIEPLPQGSSRLMDDYTFKLFAEQLNHDALDETRPEGSPAEIDFSRYLADLGRRLGFSLQDIEQGLADWRTRKQAHPDTDPYEPGLAAVTAQHFDEARRLFRQSRLENESPLLQAEQRLARLQDQIAERRRLVIRDLRAEGQAASLAYDFAAALNLFQEALTRSSDRAADPEGWAEALMDAAGAHYQLGIRVGGAAAGQHISEAVAAYRAALEVRTRELLPQQWAGTQNNLGAALQAQGIRTGGEAGRGLLVEAVAAYQAALEVRTFESLPPQWAQTQMNLLRAFKAQDDAAGMASVVEALLRAKPDSKELYNAAQALYHETLFDFAATHRLTGAWLQRHREDLGARCNFAEPHLTTGRCSSA